MLVASRKHNLKHRYGITEEKYKQMLVEQNYTCKICGQLPDKCQTMPDKCQTMPDKCQTMPDKPLYVDHCHLTKTVRGLLCHQCNIALGHMKDDPVRLEKAAHYIRRSVALNNHALSNISPTSSAA